MSERPRIGVLAANGQMGAHAVEAVRHAGVPLAGVTVGPGREAAPGVPVRPLDALAAESDVLIDFSHPDAVAAHAQACLAARCAWVLGTTGLRPPHELLVARAAAGIAVVQAANFSVGVTLLLALAERAAAALPATDYDAEILERHHRRKIDAPSGTALALGHAVAEARGEPFRPATDRAGPRETGAIGFASLRGGDAVGDHRLVFAGQHEDVELAHRATDRRIFAEGALRAALWVCGRPPGRYTMRDVLDFSR